MQGQAANKDLTHAFSVIQTKIVPEEASANVKWCMGSNRQALTEECQSLAKAFSGLMPKPCQSLLWPTLRTTDPTTQRQETDAIQSFTHLESASLVDKSDLRFYGIMITLTDVEPGSDQFELVCNTNEFTNQMRHIVHGTIS